MFTINFFRVYAVFALATAVATLITLISACFMSSSQVWEIFKILYWKNGVGWIVILMSMLPMSISGLRAMFNTNYHDMFDDAPTSHMIISMVSLMSLWFRLNRVNRIVRWLIFNSLSVIQLVSLVLMLTSTLLSTFQHIHTHAQQNLFFVACILFAAVLRLDWIFVQNFWQWLPDPKEK